MSESFHPVAAACPRRQVSRVKEIEDLLAGLKDALPDTVVETYHGPGNEMTPCNEMTTSSRRTTGQAMK